MTTGTLDVRRVLPPYLYLPCRQVAADSFDPELREVEAGPGLVAYTALDRLRCAWGHDQPWVVVPITLVKELQESLHFAALLLDDGLPDGERALE